MSDLVDVRGPGECWPWRGKRNALGYGRLGRRIANRVLWEQREGPILAGMCVMHLCDNPPCCNPAHLVIGTHKTNMRDRTAKGRVPRNEKAGRCRHSNETVAQVRAAYATGRFRQRDLADSFGLSLGHVSKIVNNQQRKTDK